MLKGLKHPTPFAPIVPLALQQAYAVLQVGYKRGIMQFIRKKIEGDS
jgi:hypothetical protein